MSKWSEWDPASALTGSEIITLLQGGGNKRTTLNDIAAKVNVGIATALASGQDLSVYNGPGGFTTGQMNHAARTQFHLIYLDAEITFTDFVIAVSTFSPATSVDVGIYTCLGAGKPGACLASANISTAANGRIQATIGTPVKLPQGLYFIVMHGSTSPTLRCHSQTTDKVPAQLSLMSVSDGMTQVAAGTTTLGCVLFADAGLPGGAYTRGMDMTGTTLSSGNIVGYTTTIPVVCIKKQ